MFRNSPVGYYRLGVSAPRRWLREGYPDKDKNEQRLIAVIAAKGPVYPKTATTDHATAAEAVVVAVATVISTTDVGTGNDSATSLTFLKSFVPTDGGVGVTATNLFATLVALDSGRGHELPIVKVLNLAGGPGFGIDAGSGVEKTAILKLYAATGSSNIIFSPSASATRLGKASASANIKFRAFASALGGRQSADLEHRWMGRYQVGDVVPLHCQCVSIALEVVPDSPPVARIYNGSALVTSTLLPKDNTTPKAVGRFRGEFRIDSTMSPGIYTVVYTYLFGGYARALYDTFEVLTGGHGSGEVLSLTVVGANPSAATLAHTASGRIQAGINPMLDKGF